MRGLKLVFGLDVLGFIRSHPVWVRGLKLQTFYEKICSNQSHPVWVRGLKLQHKAIERAQLHVAPRVGAWIETM